MEQGEVDWDQAPPSANAKSTEQAIVSGSASAKRIPNFDPALDMGLDVDKRTRVFSMEDALQINQSVSVPSNVLGLQYGAQADALLFGRVIWEMAAWRPPASSARDACASA